ncbi:MAG: hypothetical protein WBB19_13260 [Desulforhopalus sp.]
MKKFIALAMAVLFVSTLSLVGTVNAGWFGTDAVASEAAAPAGEELILSGTIDENSQLVNEQGEIFNLANNEKGMEVMSMNGMKVEIKGTVMEKDGQKVVEVIEYNVLK